MNRFLRHRLVHLFAGLLLAGPMLLFSVVQATDHPAGHEQPDLVLHGELDGTDNQTYRTLPFDVPAGSSRPSTLAGSVSLRQTASSTGRTRSVSLITASK